MTEPVRIREILVNILNNAVKFTKDGGTIRFDAGSRPGADAQHIVICYRIKDTGIGMSEDFQKKSLTNLRRKKMAYGHSIRARVWECPSQRSILN